MYTVRKRFPGNIYAIQFTEAQGYHTVALPLEMIEIVLEIGYAKMIPGIIAEEHLVLVGGIFINTTKNYFLVCLKASYKQIAAEVERFKDRTSPGMGIVYNLSAYFV